MPAYTYRATGTYDEDAVNPIDLTPGAPAGKTVGDLLLLYTTQRATAAGSTTSGLTGWTNIYSYHPASSNQMEIWARIADGSATDTPTITWSDTTKQAHAWIDCFYGDVYTDLATIVAHSNFVANNNDTVLPLPTLTVTTDNCLLIAYSVKTCVVADATTLTVPGSLTAAMQHVETAANSELHACSAYAQQTTAANYDGTDITVNGTSDSRSSTGVVLALKTESAAGHPAQSRARGIPGMNTIASPFGRGW